MKVFLMIQTMIYRHMDHVDKIKSKGKLLNKFLQSIPRGYYANLVNNQTWFNLTLYLIFRI